MGKVYLSLDDLHKLYGLSPAVISAIKKKRKRRRNKKNKKINNGTMGNKPSDSSHMEGYSSALAVAAQQLQQTNINKHILAINDKNEHVRIEQEKTNLHANDPRIQLLNNTVAGVQSGKITTKLDHKSIKLTDKTKYKKRGPKPKSNQVEELDSEDEPAGAAAASATFTLGPEFYQPSLANNSSRNMNRDILFTNVLGDILGDGITGSLNKGTGDEKFVVEAPPVFDASAPTIDIAAEEQAKQDALDEEQAKQDALDEAQAQQDAIDEEQAQQDAIEAQAKQDAIDAAALLQQQADHELRVQAQYKALTTAKLDKICKDNHQKYPKAVKNKDDRYNYLKGLGLIPEV